MLPTEDLILVGRLLIDADYRRYYHSLPLSQCIRVRASKTTSADEIRVLLPKVEALQLPQSALKAALRFVGLHNGLAIKSCRAFRNASDEEILTVPCFHMGSSLKLRARY